MNPIAPRPGGAHCFRWALLTAVFWVFSAAEARALEAVAYRLKWLFNVSVVGDLWADVHGDFREMGLAVTVREGGPERDAIKEIELGHARFGVASADQVIRARAKGSPVVVVAQLFQVNPLQWIYRPDEVSIGRLSDLRGKTLGVTFGGNDETILRTLLAKAGISENQVKLFSVRYDYTPFYRRQVHLWPVYRNAQAVILREKLGQAGEAVAFFNPEDWGVNFVANSVVTSETLVREQPEMVGRFVRGLLRGWSRALNPANETAALDMLQTFDRDTRRDVLRAQLESTRLLVRPRPETSIGAIDTQAWVQTEQILLDQGLIPSPVKVQGVLRPEFAGRLP